MNDTAELQAIRSSSLKPKEDSLRSIFGNKSDAIAYAFIKEQLEQKYSPTIQIITEANKKHLIQGEGKSTAFVDLRLLNQIYKPNVHFQTINKMLPEMGLFIGCVETISERKNRLRTQLPKLLFKPVWVADFMFNRVLPKVGLTRRLYSFATKSRYHVLSKAEVLGRLSYCGFEIIDYKIISNRLYYSVLKTGKPKTDLNPSYGIIFKMRRVSKNGKIIGVYKVRTMHPYSEYIQDYVVRINGYNKNGKPNHDFRLTSWGKTIRRYYLDEIPQLLNVVRGELNLVGVRPLSEFGFRALPEALQKERIKYKPGCIPPNVSLGITGFKGVIHAERIYLNSMKNNAFLTNFRFFWMAMYNIISRKSQSS